MERKKRSGESLGLGSNKRILITSLNELASHSSYLQSHSTQETTTSTTSPLRASPCRTSHNDYTIGWICALRDELAAAEAMLDEIHPDLPPSLIGRDPNIYSLGRIGSHNIVITYLPTGGTGTSNAASAAANLLRSFPNVRFGLMVGVGGGVPGSPSDDPNEDIHLGDVVMSVPVHNSGGVIQYDFGKALRENELKLTGFLNSPPNELRTAVMKLQARHRRVDSLIPKYLREMLESFPVMAESFQYQGAEHDLLFEANYEHNNGNQKDCACCDKSRLVVRGQRRTTDPVIHYGLIGSANQVVRNSALREKLRRELSVLCVEMEAAGLMNNFPCLVIRGICDYADTHKNKRWQPYAAATAAASAKELLQLIPASENIATTPISREFREPYLQLQEEFMARVKRTEDTMVDIFEYLKEKNFLTLPQQNTYKWKEGLSLADLPILLRQASHAAPVIHLPRNFEKSLKDFYDISKIILHNMPSANDDRKEYRPEGDVGKVLMNAKTWNDTILPISIVLREMIAQGQKTIQQHSCARCEAERSKTPLREKWVPCDDCTLSFDIYETDRVVELQDYDNDSPLDNNPYLNAASMGSSSHASLPSENPNVINEGELLPGEVHENLIRLRQDSSSRLREERKDAAATVTRNNLMSIASLLSKP